MSAESITRSNFTSLWNFQKPDESEARFRELLDTIDVDESDYRLEVRTQVARTLGLQRQFDAAHAELDAVEEQLDEAEPIVRIRYLLERGRAFNSSKQPQRAQPLFEQAWDVARAAGRDSLAIDAAHMVAIAAPADVGHQWNLKALELARSTEDQHASGWQGALLNNIGWYHHNQGDYQKAYDCLTEAWQFRDRLDRGNGVEEPTFPHLAFRWSAVKQLRFLGRIDEALTQQRELEGIWQQRGEPSGFVFEEIAECLLLKGEEDEAREYFAKAYEILKDSWVNADEPERIKRLGELGASG